MRNLEKGPDFEVNSEGETRKLTEEEKKELKEKKRFLELQKNPEFREFSKKFSGHDEEKVRKKILEKWEEYQKLEGEDNDREKVLKRIRRRVEKGGVERILREIGKRAE